MASTRSARPGAGLRRALLQGLLVMLPAVASAQGTPIRILVGFPAGGESDLVARLLADRMGAALGAPVVVENRPGAGGLLVVDALKQAAPDGRTLMIAPTALTVFAPLTHSRLRFDPQRDLAPVSLVANFQMALAVGPASPAATLQEHLAWARIAPTRATYGVPIAGGPTHFFGGMLARASGVPLAAVPYQGAAPLTNDLLGGQVPAAVTALSQVARHHRNGALRVLATTGTRRSALAPDVPTFAELGYGALEGTGWQAFHTVAGTPRPVVERLAAAIAQAVRAPEAVERLVAMGLEPVGSTPDELATRIAEDIARWAPVVKASGFRADE
ncbi:MAG: tripartite tricarboxylate transporter substrate-binding protein [Pseudomonadota bacterium]